MLSRRPVASLLLIALLSGSAAGGAQEAVRARRRPRARRRASRKLSARSPLAGNALPSSANCTWVLYNQTLDHFARGATRGGGATFTQRLCLYDGFVRNKKRPSLVLFYTGNESPVEE